MNNPKSEALYKVAIARHPKDGQPKVTTFTIEQFIRRVERAPISSTPFDAYHFQKSEQKRLSTESRTAKDAGDIDLAKALKAQAKTYGDAIDNTKFGPAIQPFIFRDDVTFKMEKGWPQRASDRITHFSLVMLDVESKTSREELHDVLRDYEYVLWPTITHKLDDPRYRIVLFPSQPLTIPEAQALIYRIDARLPSRNDPGKKLRNLDPSCLDVGRLMFLPKWLINHPEPYSIVHNVGDLLTQTSFDITPEIQVTIDARIAAAEQHRSKLTAEKIALQKSVPASGASIIVTMNGKDWLNPDALFETKDGYVRLSDVTTKISGVLCPFHADTIGSEFLAPNKYTRRPQLVCAKCSRVFKMAPPPSEYTDSDTDDVDTTAFAPLINKARFKRTTAPTKLVSVPTKPQIEFLDGPIVRYLSERWLPDIRNIIPDRGLFFVRSPKGTGKTQALGALVKSARDAERSVLVLTHRRSLARNLSNRLKLSNYQDLEGGTLSNFSVVCVNSLTSRLKESAARYDIVIVDESEQVLRNLLSETLKYHLSDIFNKILLLLKNAQRVICLDADLSSELTIDIIARMRDPKHERADDDYIGIINNFRIGTGKTVRCLQSRYQLLAEISRAADEGKKLFIACSTARAATVIGTSLASQDKSVLIITAKTSNDPDVMAFQSDPNDSVGQYDVVVASPSLQTGFSIDPEYFDQIYGWFQSVDGITFQDYDQALSRVRHCDHVTVWVEGTRTPPRIDPPEIFVQRAIIREMKTRKLLPGETHTLSDGERLWVGIEGQINYLTALWSHQRDVKFKAMKADLGFAIEDIERDEDDERAGKMLWTAFKDVGPDHAAAVYRAAELNDDEYLELQRKNHKTNDDHLALKRYRIADAIDQELTQDLVAQAIDEDLLQVVAKARSLVIDDDDTRVRSDVKDRVRHSSAFTKAGHRTREHELLVEHLCKAADIDIKAYYARLSAGETIEVPVSLMDRLVDAFMEREPDFRYFFNLRIGSIDRAVSVAKQLAGDEWTPEAEAVAIEEAKQYRRKRVWNGTFGAVGLPITKKRRGPRNNQVACYFIDPKSVELTTQAIVREQQIHERVWDNISRLLKKAVF